MVLREVNGLISVAARSRRSVHLGMLDIGSLGAEGRVSVGPRVSAPPVNGEGVNCLAGWGEVGSSGRDRAGG